MGSLEIRKARQTDNLKEIAKLIYLTDPYIYPYWFNKNEEEGVRVLSNICKNNCAFNYKNCIVALQNNKIIGLIVAFDENANLTYNFKKFKKISKNYAFTIENYAYLLKNDQEKGVVYISNCCVLEEYRRHNVASKMFDYLFSIYPNKIFKLDVLADNTPALKLYKKEGFSGNGFYFGFNEEGKEKPKCLHMVKTL